MFYVVVDDGQQEDVLPPDLLGSSRCCF